MFGIGLFGIGLVIGGNSYFLRITSRSDWLTLLHQGTKRQRDDNIRLNTPCKKKKKKNMQIFFPVRALLVDLLFVHMCVCCQHAVTQNLLWTLRIKPCYLCCLNTSLSSLHVSFPPLYLELLPPCASISRLSSGLIIAHRRGIWARQRKLRHMPLRVSVMHNDLALRGPPWK